MDLLYLIRLEVADTLLEATGRPGMKIDISPTNTLK